MTDRTDDFNRANGGLGANWTAIADANHATLAIATNKVVVGTANTDCASIWTADTFQNDQYSEATYTVGTSFSNQGCIVRGRTSPNIRYYDFVAGSGGAFVDAIEYYDGTTWNALAISATGSGSGVVRCEVTGTALTGKFNGTTKLTATDATLSSGAPGLHLYDNAADSTMDDWLGGPITAATQPSDYYSASLAQQQISRVRPPEMQVETPPTVRALPYFRQRAHNGATSVASITVTISPTIAGSFLVVAGIFITPQTGVVLSDPAGDAATPVVAPFDRGDGIFAYCSAFYNVTPGVTSVTATAIGGSNDMDLFVWEIAGMSNPTLDRTSHATGNSALADSGPTGTLANQVEAAIAYVTSGINATGAGTGWSNFNLEAATGSGGEEQVTTSNSSIDGTFPNAASIWGALVATFTSVPAVGESDYYSMRSVAEARRGSAKPHLLSYDATPFIRQVAFRQRAHGGGGGSATRAVSFGAGVTAGSIIIVAGMFDSATTSVTISDDKGDTPTTVIATKLSGDGGAKYYCSAFLALTTGAITVTATYSGATPTFDCLFIWEGVGLTNPVADKFPDAQGTGTAADSGSTGTLSAAVELAIAFGITADVFTTGGTGWTNVNIDASTGSIGEERVIAATTAINGTGTTSLSAAWDILCATFMSGTSGVPSGSSDYYATRSIMEGIITSANPHLLQYDGFAPSPKVQAQGDTGYYNVEVVPPTKAGRPAFESYPPRGNVPSPVVPYGKTDYFDSRLFSQTLRWAKPQWQQHDSYALRFVQQLAPPGAGGPVWFYDARLQLVARAGKPSTFTFPFDGFQPLGSIATVAQVYGADSYFQSDAYPKLRFRDQHDAHAPRGLVPTAATPQGWTAYFDEDHPPKFKSSLHPVDQDQTPDLPPFAATQGWTATFDSRAVKARPVREYEATGITFTAAATVVTGATDYQSFDLFQPFRPARFPYEAVYPAMGLVPTAATPQGWWTPLDVARVRPFGAQLQQHDGYQHFFPPVAVNLGPLGWSMYWDRGRKPLLPDRLPFLFEQLYQTPTTFVPNGWTSPLLDTARVKVFRASLQQYDALQRLSFVPPFIVPPGDWYDVRIIRPRPRDYQVVDRPMFFPPPFPFDWVDARVIRPRAVSYSVIDQQPAVVVPPSAYVLFPDLFKRPRPFPYLLWPEQRVAVLNTPAGTGGPSHYFDRRLAVFHRPVVDVLTYDHRGLPFVVVNLIIQKPGPAGLLSGVSLSATKAQDTLAGLKGGTGLQGEVEG